VGDLGMTVFIASVCVYRDMRDTESDPSWGWLSLDCKTNTSCVPLECNWLNDVYNQS